MTARWEVGLSGFSCSASFYIDRRGVASICSVCVSHDSEIFLGTRNETPAVVCMGMHACTVESREIVTETPKVLSRGSWASQSTSQAPRRHRGHKGSLDEPIGMESVGIGSGPQCGV